MSKLWIENTSNYPSVICSSLDYSTTHTDKTTDVISWDKYGLDVLQYLHVRRKIQPLIIAKCSSNPLDSNTYFDNWTNGLTLEEKKIACNWIIAPYSLRITINSDADDLSLWTILVEKSKGFNILKDTEGRAYIIEEMRMRVSENLRKDLWTFATSNQFYYDTKDHIMAYMFANTTDLIDWISNKVGSLYENNGFAQTSYYDATLQTDLIKIYNDYY